MHRGGLGYVRTWTVSADNAIYSALTERVKIRPRGLLNGKPGTNSGVFAKTKSDRTFKTFVERFGVQCPGKFSGIELHSGDKVKLVIGGGGGWGDPLKREPVRVLRDVLTGFVSRQSAAREYGVALVQKAGKLDVDIQRTQALRRKLSRK